MMFWRRWVVIARWQGIAMPYCFATTRFTAMIYARYFNRKFLDDDGWLYTVERCTPKHKHDYRHLKDKYGPGKMHIK